MLKALELAGFKSFADRARFELPSGITVIVGPNGSGKSNIVDAIKWVLGDQSPKSLRGQEMADVIFKGSGASGRKPMNAAEATLIFDNADGKLPIDAPEVHVTRRVFRSGEGEYLINRQPARLRDIRDMFRGTGVGADAYSLIEQGKVDRLLQASARDRRAIFEEAAGISRFKAKKVEAQRRLERVEQNLLRLADIVEEVENRVKTVRAQAGKARRYREYTQRLQELRTAIAHVDWQRLSDKLAGIEYQIAALAEQIQTADAQTQRLEASQLELETSAATAAEELHNCENRLAGARQQLTQHHATLDHERSRAAELDDEITRHQKNLLAMSDRAGDLRSRLAATQGEVQEAEQALVAAQAEASRREDQLAAIALRLAAGRQQTEDRRKQHLDLLQYAAALASKVEAGQTKVGLLRQSIQQLERQLAEATTAERQVAEQLTATQSRERQLADESADQQRQLEAAQNELAENRNLHASRADDLAQLHSRRQGVAQRHDVLEEFERTLEGFGTGVKQVLAKAGAERQAADPAAANERVPWSSARGIVADFLEVGLEHSAAIDAALGDAAQHVVVQATPTQVLELAQDCADLAGRVVLLPKPNQPRLTAELASSDVAGLRVIARADKLVHCADEFQPLAELLLGTTFVVDSLADALQLRERAAAGTRVVTLTGELVDQNGAVHLGPRSPASGLVSRRSQLRAARLDLAVLDQQIIDAHRETQHRKREVERHEHAVRTLQEAAADAMQRLIAERAQLQTLSQRAEQLRGLTHETESSLADLSEQMQSAESSMRQQGEQLLAAQGAAEQIQAAIAAEDQSLVQLGREREAAVEQATCAKIDLARCHERLETLRHRLTQFEGDQRERDRAVAQVVQQLQQAEDRRVAADVAMLTASSQAAQLELARQSISEQATESRRRRDAAVRDRGPIADQLTALRREALALRDQDHQLELAAGEVRHQRQTLADRLREDYGLELAELTDQPTAAEAQQRAEVEEEIESLRRKINQIGAVNLDALEELDELEQRFATLSTQHKDLADAKQSLERIIHKINADSRRLFLDTLEAIRVNFQALYRKAFGGGKADIVLEEGVDVLDCGVEIIATPPGKPSFNNSLLSGGEKALTAVALLLAIFQFRPSPFCVLDEVDAPFDEANIGRFIEVLKEFLGWTRFVIVTHSKKTMTAATTLYGVTMQESGVSKRVSVRFDDVSEDGHIRREALDRSGDDLGAARGVA